MSVICSETRRTVGFRDSLQELISVISETVSENISSFKFADLMGATGLFVNGL